MEVFLRNLPRHLTDQSLQRHLQPCMDQLSIVDYLAEKQRNKRFGHVTFLHKADGQLFLRHHGEEILPLAHSQYSQHLPRPGMFHSRSRARLTLMGEQVFCMQSNREPNELTLRTLEREASQRRYYDEEPAEPTKALDAIDLSCGYYTFEGERLVFTAEWVASDACLVRFTRRNLLITMKSRGIQLRISFQSIVELVWRENGTAAVTLRWAPTILASPTIDDDLAAMMLPFMLAGRNAAEPQGSQRRRLEAIDPDHSRVSAFCLVYCFRVPNPVTRHSASDFESEMYRVNRKQLFGVTRHNLEFRHPGPMRFDTAMEDLRIQLAQHTTTSALPFSHLFLLQALVANSYLHPATVSALAERLVRGFSEAKKTPDDRPPVSADALKKLFEWIDYPSPHGDPRMFEVEGIMEYLGEAERLIRENCVLGPKLPRDAQARASIFRAVVTPTRITFHGPELEPMNRVLRKYPDHSYFIRAQFCDEDGRDLFFNSKVPLDAIYARFKSVLSKGIQVAGRDYKLLGFSHSSLRAHSAWLSAPFTRQNQVQFPEFIITGLGNFDKIQSPARRAARIGQAFSETPHAVDLDEAMTEVVMIPDVERNGRVFSDGVGTISPGAVDAVYQVIPERKGLPTCFQIRWAGAKGMLSLDPRLEGNKICIRPSMVKFESDDRHLEICDMASKPVPMVLNRQLIKILEDMGAPSEWFLRRQHREVQRLRGITATVYNTTSFLRSQKIGQDIRLHKFLRQTEAMGIDFRGDSFLRGVVEVVLLRELRLLKHKARIPVDRGMTLFGVMDETGFLEEGEVYVTYDSGDQHSKPPGPGPCIVTRSPALHPGDVQIARNTVPPSGHPLLRLRNCIVFSMWGDRDLPSQLSGGDLDGDVFHVVWEQALVSAVRTFEPAQYARIAPLELDRPVETADIAAFFVDFMATDHLGVIATRHMILADQKADGTLDPSCVKLAELHSAAVDFSKTGRAVEMRELPLGGKWRPDFLAPGPSIIIHDKSDIDFVESVFNNADDDEDGDDSPRHRYYASDKVLGQLYRAIDEQRIWANDIKTVASAKGPCFWDQFVMAIEERLCAFGPVNWRHRSEEARRIRYAYQDAIYGVMTDFAEHPNQPLRELEVFVGFIVSKTGAQSRRQRDQSVKFKDEFERIATWITRELRTPTSLSGYTTRLHGLELCLACVYVDMEGKEQEMHPGQRISARDVESFRIIAASALMSELSALEGCH